MTTPHEGTTTLLDLASELAEVAPHVKDGFDLGRACKLMQRAAEVIERLAPTDPDIEASPGEN